MYKDSGQSTQRGDNERLPQTAEIAAIEYEIRQLNLEIFDIHNKNLLRMDDVRELDRLMAQKTALMMQAHAEAFPEAAQTLREMITTLQASDDDDDDATRAEYLRQILADLMEAYAQAEPGSERYDELQQMIQAIEHLLLSLSMRRRHEAEDFGLQ